MKKINYRLGNILRGGKQQKTNETNWDMILKSGYFPNSIANKYINQCRNNKFIPSSKNIHSFTILNKIIKEYDYEKPNHLTCIISLRLGDVLDKSNYSVEEHLKDNLSSECKSIDDVQRIQPLSFFKKKIDKLKSEYNFIKNINIITSFHKSEEADEGSKKSREYLNIIRELFESNNFNVELNINSCESFEYVDKDFIYFCNAKYIIFSDSNSTFSEAVKGLILLNKYGLII